MKTVMITGASRGIGRAAAIRFAEAGYDLALNCANNAELLEETAGMLMKRGTRCLTYVGDMSVYENAEEFVKRTVERFGEPDVLINNAGISRVGLFTDTTPDEWKRVIDVNLGSVYNCCRCVLPYMLKKEKARIINVSSIWGVTGGSCEVAYSASKGGVNAFTKALGKELARGPVRVNAVAFGPVDTDMNRILSAEDRDLMEEDIPAGRMASPEEAAEFILRIAEAGDYLTGQVIGFDGGWN